MFTAKEQKDFADLKVAYERHMSLSQIYLKDGATATAATKLEAAAKCLRDMANIESNALRRKAD